MKDQTSSRNLRGSGRKVLITLIVLAVALLVQGSMAAADVPLPETPDNMPSSLEKLSEDKAEAKSSINLTSPHFGGGDKAELERILKTGKLYSIQWYLNGVKLDIANDAAEEIALESDIEGQLVSDQETLREKSKEIAKDLDPISTALDWHTELYEELLTLFGLFDAVGADDIEDEILDAMEEYDFHYRLMEETEEAYEEEIQDPILDEVFGTGEGGGGGGGSSEAFREAKNKLNNRLTSVHSQFKRPDQEHKMLTRELKAEGYLLTELYTWPDSDTILEHRFNRVQLPTSELRDEAGELDITFSEDSINLNGKKIGVETGAVYRVQIHHNGDKMERLLVPTVPSIEFRLERLPNGVFENQKVATSSQSTAAKMFDQSDACSGINQLHGLEPEGGCSKNDYYIKMTEGQISKGLPKIKLIKKKWNRPKKIDKSSALVSELGNLLNEKGSIFFTEQAYHTGQTAKLHYILSKNLSSKTNIKVNWYADTSGQFGEDALKGSSKISAGRRRGIIEAPIKQGDINIQAELIIQRENGENIQVDKAEATTAGTGLFFSKENYDYNEKTTIDVYLAEKCEKGECKIEWYGPDGEKVGEDDVPKDTKTATIPMLFEDKSGVVKARLKRSGNIRSEAKARIEAQFGRLKFKNDSYVAGEEAKVQHWINSEGVYSVAFYLDGEMVGSEKIKTSRGKTTFEFNESGDAEARLLLSYRGEQAKVGEAQANIRSQPGTPEDTPMWLAFDKSSFKPAKEEIKVNYHIKRPGYFGVKLYVDGEKVGERRLPEEKSSGSISWYIDKEGEIKVQAYLLDKPGGESLGGKDRSEILEIQEQDIRNRSEVLNLSAGWNMLSTSRAVSIRGIETDCNILEFQGFRNWYYLAGEWKHSEVLNPGTGYFVSMKENCEAVIEPTYNEEDDIKRDISRGWNMISVPFPTSMDKIKSTCSFEKFKDHRIWYFTGSEWENPGMNDELDPKKGYYVKSRNNCKLSTTSRQGSAPEAPLPEAREANDASQCIKVNKGLCNCKSGGESIAINEEYKDEWESYLSELKEYKSKSCAGVSRCRKTKITVKDGMCTLENAD